MRNKVFYFCGSPVIDVELFHSLNIRFSVKNAKFALQVTICLASYKKEKAASVQGQHCLH